MSKAVSETTIQNEFNKASGDIKWALRQSAEALDKSDLNSAYGFAEVAKNVIFDLTQLLAKGEKYIPIDRVGEEKDIYGMAKALREREQNLKGER